MEKAKSKAGLPPPSRAIRTGVVRADPALFSQLHQPAEPVTGLFSGV